MESIMAIAQHGLDVPEIGGTALHIAVGMFFAGSGLNKLFNSERHKTFVATLSEDKVPFLSFNQWWVPGWELVGGAGLAMGAFPAIFASILLVIILVAICCEGSKRVATYAPINGVDQVADWLYLPEVLYGLILAAIVMGV